MINAQNINISGKGPKLFHMADFHLGSPFSGLDVKSSDLRRSELIDSFALSVELAQKEGCSAILIAGDLFDCGYVDSETVSRTYEILGRCGLPVVISPGNHDPYTDGGVYGGKNIPDNVMIFDSPELSFFDLDGIGVRVHGYAFETERYTSDPLFGGAELLEGGFNVLCAHGDIYSPLSTYAPINLAQLEGMGFDYVALGHIHKYSEPMRAGKTVVAYSGFPEGRSFDECGFGGALIVTLSYGRTPAADVKRIILSSKQYLASEIDVTGAASKSDLILAVKRYVESNALGRETSLRLTLRGNIDAAVSGDLILSASDVGVAMLDIRNETLPFFDAEYLENDVTLRGALYRQLLPSLNSPDPETRRVAIGALRMGLAALEGRALTR